MNRLLPIWKCLSKEGKEAMASALDTSTAYLSQIAHGVAPGKHFKKLLDLEIERQERLLNQVGHHFKKVNRTCVEQPKSEN